MRITDNIFIELNNPRIEFTLGLHHEIDMVMIENEEEENEIIPMYRLVLGFLVFNITIFY
jgi:hypothetical protein